MFRKVILLLKSWIIYVVLLVAAGILNRVKPGYISSISFYIILFTPIVSLIHVAFSYFVFKLTHDVSKRHVSKGDIIEYKIKLINPSAFLLAPFALHYIASERLFKEAKNEIDKQIIVAERSNVIIRKQLTCGYRGNYEIGVDKVVIKDFFKFYKFTYDEIEQHKILVYPKLRELKSNLLRNVVNESNESIVSNTSQNQSVFTDIREYIPGDSFNKIHWKLSAKAGKFMTKDFSGQMTNKTKVFLDTYSLGLSDEKRIVYEDYMVEGCVSIMHFLLENRIHSYLYYEHYGINKLEGRNSNDFPKFYDELAGISFYKEERFIETINNVLKIESDTCHIVIMTQKIDPQLAEQLIKLKFQNYEVSVIVCDTKTLDIEELGGVGDHKSRFMLITSNIPIYYMQHDESSTKLGVS